MMSVQLTGGSGFIGSNISKLINAEFIPSKISLTDSFTINADVFIHLAGLAHNIDGKKLSNEYYSINTDLTKKAFNAFLLSNAKKFILLSSVKAIRNDSDFIINENTIECPSTDYGKSKLEADHYILSHHLPIGKSVYILRPALITGPKVKGNMRRLYNFSNTPFNWFFPSINNQRSYCNILNLSFVIEQIIKRNDIPSGIYLLADNETISTSDIVNELSKKKIIYRYFSIISTFLLNLLLSLDKLMGYTSVLKPLRTLTSNYVISNTKITNALGESLPFSCISGIRSIKDK
jgi:nucleoside-diphosphate-sugar epimerase